MAEKKTKKKPVKKENKLTTVNSIFGEETSEEKKEVSSEATNSLKDTEEILNKLTEGNEENEEITEENEEEINEEEEIEEKEVEINDTPVKSQPNVRVRPNKDVNTFIGDRYYRLKKGVQVTVPQNVKDILMKAKLLDPI